MRLSLSRLAVVALTGAAATACASPRPANAAQPASASAPVSSVTAVAALPRRSAVGGASTLSVIESARGAGSKYVGTFRVLPAGELYIQMACAGGHPLLLAGIVKIGPCANGTLVETARFKPSGQTLKLSVSTAPGLSWGDLHIPEPAIRQLKIWRSPSCRLTPKEWSSATRYSFIL